MANLVLVGAIQCEVNHAFMITVTQFQVDGDRPVAVRYGAQGAIGSARGAEKVTGSFTLAIPSGGLEPDLLGAMEAPGGFTFSFPIGAERHSIYGALRTKRGLSSSMESGDSNFTVSFTGTDWIRTE